MKHILRLKPGTKYSYEALLQFFGGENFNGIDTPEINFEVGGRVINIVFECDRIVDGDNGDSYIVIEPRSYTLVEVSSWATS